MSTKDKFGLGYGNQIHEGVLSYEKEVLESVFDSRSSDVEDSPVYDRFVKVEGMHAVPPLMIGNYMPPKSDSDDEYVIEPLKEQEKPSFAFFITVKHSLKRHALYMVALAILLEIVTFIRKEWLNRNDPQKALKNKGNVDSGCSRHMTGIKPTLLNIKTIMVASKAYISGKGKIKTRKLDFEDVCFVKELQHSNPLLCSNICVQEKNKVLFTNTECLVLSPDFKLPDENQVLLRVLRQNNMYSFNLENIIPTRGLACLIVKATVDKSNKWHRRLGHVNFKNLNKLVKGNLVRGLTSMIFKMTIHGGCLSKGKQHKALYKAKLVSSISQPLQLLHMDLFGPTSVRSINHKTYCLVITDDFSRFSWVFFLRTKDETSGILKDFIRQIENQLNQKVKTIRLVDNGTKYKNPDIINTGSKGIKREYNNARTPQQNGVAERKNRTLIKAARTMLADSFLPNTFWAEAVSTACYVLNRVLVTKPQNKTPYELITGKYQSYAKTDLFGVPCTILEIPLHTGKFEEKSDEGFLVGYSLNSKAFRVYNLETKRVEENLHINFLENKPNVAGKGPNWLFDLDYLTDSMNYQPVTAENKANKTAGPKEANHSAGTQDNIDAGNSEIEAEPAQEYFVLPVWSSYTSTVKSSEAKNGDVKPNGDTGAARATSTNRVNTISTPISTASPSNVFSAGGPDLNNNDQDDSQIPALEDIYDNPSDGIFTNASYDDEGAVADFTNLETTVEFIQFHIRITPFILQHKFLEIQPQQFRQGAKYTKVLELMLLLAIFKSREEIITRISSTKAAAIQDSEELDLLICLLEEGNWDKMGLQNKKDERGVVVRNKARSWCDEFKALMKRKFQMNSMGELTFFLGLQVKQKEDGIFISQDKYVAEILKKFDFASVKTASTPIKTQKSLTKDEEAADVDVHLYRSMIGSLIYLTASRPDTMFVVCACFRFQVTPKTSHLHAVKRIFRRDYLMAVQEAIIVANSTTEQSMLLLPYCLWQNPVFHSKTKHIEIRHHFIRDAYEKKLIQVLKIHTDDNVADLLTKAFDLDSMNLSIAALVEGSKVGAAKHKVSAARKLVMLSDKAKLKGVEIKEKKDAERPARLVLTLKPLPKIDPKDKGKGVLEEEPEPVKVKSKDQGEAQIERDAEIALKVQAIT
ncbi:putative ribonuclease H-like domain-containing protein [Tanacetum coccineum]